MRFLKFLLEPRYWLACLAVFFTTQSAQAAYPEKQITLVIPFAPGGANDTLGRIIAQALSVELKQTVIVENRAGAGTTIGAEYVANTKPDGYTLLVVSAAHVISSSIYTKLRFDPVKSFTPITQLTKSAYVLVTNKDSQIKSVQDLLAMASKQPNKMTYASSGIGSAPHLAGALLGSKGGVELVHVPYKGGGPALLDVMRGDVDVYFASQSTALPYIQSDKVRALGISTEGRSPALPSTPTLRESGVPGFELSGWYGLVGPSQLPASIVQVLNDAIKKILAREDIQATLAKHGEQAYSSKADVFGQFLSLEQKKYQEIIQIAKIEKE